MPEDKTIEAKETGVWIYRTCPNCDRVSAIFLTKTEVKQYYEVLFGNII